MDTVSSSFPNDAEAALRNIKHEIDCDHFIVWVRLARAWCSCVISPQPECLRSRGVLWTSNQSFILMSKPWHHFCVSVRPETGFWLRAAKTRIQFFLLKSAIWIFAWPPGASVLWPASLNSVASWLTAKNLKVGFPPPDLARGLSRAGSRPYYCLIVFRQEYRWFNSVELFRLRYFRE